MSVDPAQIPALVEAFDAAVAEQIRERQLGDPAVEHDGVLPFEAIDEPLLVDLEQLAPYGVEVRAAAVLVRGRGHRAGPRC